MSESDSDDDAVAAELDDGEWQSEIEGYAEEGKCPCVSLFVLGFTHFFVDATFCLPRTEVALGRGRHTRCRVTSFASCTPAHACLFLRSSLPNNE